MRATDNVEIGSTGLRVTRLGLGGVALSGAPPSTDPHRPSPELEAVRLIRRSLALGLNYLDTAPMYGVGESEKRYGQALRDIPRDRYVLSTKVGRVLRPDPAGSGKTTWAFDFSREGARASFASSLERLGLEGVDIVFVHDPDDHYQAALAGAYPVLMELRAEGRIGAIGAGMNQWQMELAFAREGDAGEKLAKGVARRASACSRGSGADVIKVEEPGQGDVARHTLKDRPDAACRTRFWQSTGSLPGKGRQPLPGSYRGSLSKRPEDGRGCRCAAGLCPAMGRWGPTGRRATFLPPADRLCRTLR